jgi:tripartite-type tricarboxylate transporter receptor subunit TctC
LLTSNISVSQLYINARDERFLTNGKADFDKVIAYAKEKSGQLIVASYGGMDALDAIYLSKIGEFLKIEPRIVSYDKPAERYGSLVGRHVDILIENPGDVRGLIDAKEILPVLSITKDRVSLFPDTPAMGKDYGMDWVFPQSWRALYVRKETPPEIFNYLVWVMKKAWDIPAHQRHIKEKWLNPDSYRNPSETERVTNSEIELYAKTYRALGMPSIAK